MIAKILCKCSGLHTVISVSSILGRRTAIHPLHNAFGFQPLIPYLPPCRTEMPWHHIQVSNTSYYPSTDHVNRFQIAFSFACLTRKGTWVFLKQRKSIGSGSSRRAARSTCSPQRGFSFLPLGTCGLRSAFPCSSNSVWNGRKPLWGYSWQVRYQVPGVLSDLCWRQNRSVQSRAFSINMVPLELCWSTH